MTPALRPGPIGRTGTLWLLAAVLAVFPQTGGATPRYVCAEALMAAQRPAGVLPGPRSKPAATAPLSQVTALVVFTGFRGQPTGVPSWAGSLFDPDRPGSVSHFYREMSFGSLTLRGTVAPRRYLASGDAGDYTAAGPTELGRYSEFVQEILRQVDEDLDLAAFDDDGPDGRPDSGDDDGEVDLVVVLTPALPRNFLFGGATGIRDLGLLETVATSDPGADGRPIGYRTGLVAQGRTFAEAAGTVAHELGHALFALPDLYNVAYLSREGPPGPAGDSAGIGHWGLMGWGALGWGGDDGPVSFSAWSRLRLGWAQVTEAAGASQRILLRDVAETGEVVRIPAGGEEYFLLEYRTRSSFYDRGIPAEGLLIWHVMSNPTGEVTRAHWLVDLECADGRWQEAGFPLGRTPDPVHGGDNLDFWAHDADYTRSHAGNLGDATDVFGPGGRTAFTAATNPSSADREGRSTCAVTAIEVTARGVEARVEVGGPRIEFGGFSFRDQTGDGLLVAGEEAVLRLDLVNQGGLPLSGAILTLESLDGLLTVAPERHELPVLLPDVHHLGGVFETPPRIVVSGDFASSRVARLRATVAAGGDTLGRRDMQIPVVSARQEGLQWQVRDWQGTDRIDPGDLFHLDLRLQAKDPDLLQALNFHLTSPSEAVERVSGGAVRFVAEGRESARSTRTPEFLALAGAAGTELPFVLQVRTRFQVWTDTAAFAVSRLPDITPPRLQHLRLSPAGDGLIVRASQRHILEGSAIRRVAARIHGLPDSSLRAEVSMVDRDGVYEALWQGPPGTYSISVVMEDAGGNVGESGASRIEIGAGGEPLRVVEPVGPGPGVEPYRAGDWRPEGPGVPLEARLREIQPAAGGAWYGRTRWRVWRSPDEGASWQPAPFMLSGRDRSWDVYSWVDLTRTVQGHVEDPLTAYVVEGGDYSGGFEGIFTTLDGGASWSAVPVPEGVQAAFVDDHLPDRLYAASVSAVFVSDDGGRKWREYPVEGRALGVWSHPADPGRTYAWVDSLEGGRGLWRLDGDGARAVGSSPVRGHALPTPDPWTPGGFYIHRWKELFHTSDEGATWRAIVPDVGSSIWGLAVSDSEPGLIYAHGERLLYRSQDGGETWQGTGIRLDGYEFVERMSAFGPSGLVVQTDEGVYVSTDWGETAVAVTVEETVPPAGTVWFDDLDRVNMATILSRDGEQYMGIYRRDGGAWEWIEGWAALPWLGGAWQVVYQDPWSGGVLIAHLPATTGYMRSTTGGATWELLGSGGTIGLPHGTHPFLHRPSIFADLSRPGVIYLADAGLWISFDHGESWERMGPYADREDPSSVRDYVELGNLRPAGALLASRDTLAVLYGDSLWVGHKDGRDWKLAGRLEPGVSGLDLARHPDQPGVLYAAAGAGCYVSADGGRTWRRVLEPRSGSWETARLRGHPTEVDALYLAADRELYHSPDRGSTWRALDAGYPGVPWINDVAVDPLDPSILYVATSAGLFSIEAPPTSIAGDLPVPRTTELMGSYPNPFNASTVIPFRLAATGRVRIDVFNLLGQRVRRLLDEPRAPGRHKVHWSGTDDRGIPGRQRGLLLPPHHRRGGRDPALHADPVIPEMHAPGSVGPGEHGLKGAVVQKELLVPVGMDGVRHAPSRLAGNSRMSRVNARRLRGIRWLAGPG